MKEVFSRGIEELRNKLIDTSRRNKLINYKRPSKSRNLKIIDESAEFIFNHLVQNESKFEFKSIPEPDIDSHEIEELKKEKETLEKKLNEKNPSLFENERKELNNKLKTITLQLNELQKQALLSAEERAKELGFNISNELPDINLMSKDIDTKYIDNLLQTLHYPNEMEKILKNIERNARSIIEETGSNMLYLILGVLEWQEADYSDKTNKSPLITIPVTLSKLKFNNRYFFTLEYSGEGLETNRSLAEKLLFEFGIILPELTEDVSFSAYIEQVKTTIKNKKRWRIKQEIALDFLHFGKILMYQDLKEENWKDGLFSNPILQDIFIGKVVTSDSIFAQEYDIDTNEIANSIPLVMDADSSQHSAIVDVIENKNVIIEGPPGTGKSQTIANIIASLLAEGKSILFVSEKLAALEVVYKRLENIGLGDFCLELHSNKSKKTQILHSIKKRMDSSYQNINEIDYTIKNIEYKKEQIREYINIIHQKYGNINQTIYSIFWKAELFRDSAKNFTFDIPNAKQYTPFELSNILEELTKFKHFHENYDYESFFWQWLDLYKLNFTNIDNFLFVLDDIKEKFKKLSESLLQIPCNFENEFNDIKDINNFVKSFQLATKNDPFILSQLNNNINEFVEYTDNYINLNKITQRLDETLQQFKNKINYNRKIISNLNILEKEIKRLHIDFNFPKNFDIEFINLLVKLFGLLEQLDIKQYKNISVLYGTQDFDMVIVEAIKEQNKFKEYQTIISEYSSPSKIDNITFEEVDEIENIIESKKNSILNIFSSEYRKALKIFQDLLEIPLPNDKSEWTKIFREIKQYIQSKNDYNNNSRYIINFGNLFKGVDTEWDEINNLNDWAKILRNSTKNIELINIILLPNNQKFNELLAVKSILDESLLEFNNLYKHFANYYDKAFAKTLIRNKDDINIVELNDKLENINNDLEAVSRKLQTELNITSLDNFTNETIANILSIDFEEINYFVKKIDLQDDDFNHNINTFIKQSINFKNNVEKINYKYNLNLNNPINDYFKIKDTLDTYNTLKKSNIPESLKQVLFQDFNNYKKLVQISASYEDLLKALEQISIYGNFSENFLGENKLTIKECINKLEEAPKHKDTLSIWSDFRRITHSVINLGLSKLVEWVESKQLPLDKIDDVFKFNFYNRTTCKFNPTKVINFYL